eukprot:CAMPEP_0114497214 /NCGR_PEP_ID=MMETSP0109-20121206/6197_1 /TAXON_ID=29199 /ORGANISM="Chlorarachnion reptans, Strain CCCM449" /LENGTH=135 /DNA_ID=CAMNT_0001674565 /DNA_START=161 /DNA_END=568 /DNA_ORIENTATION=-
MQPRRWSRLGCPAILKDAKTNDQSKVEKLVGREKVVVFSETWCPYCLKAKNLLKDLKASFTVIELDKVQDGGRLRAELEKVTKRKTIPAIFIQQMFVGGFNDGPGVMTLHQQMKLVPILKQAGAIEATKYFGPAG